MDAPEDRDVKLHKASGNLFTTFKTELPILLWEDSIYDANKMIEQRVVRRNSTDKEVSKLVLLLEPFQEWPQLLDPELSGFMEQLTSAFLSYLVATVPLPAPARPALALVTTHESPQNLLTAVAKLLYTLAKIRGQKVIMRFLPNEPKYLEPIMGIFDADIQLDQTTSSHLDIAEGAAGATGLAWELRYIGLLWISHLLLTPFDLVTISNTPVSDTLQAEKLPSELPPFAARVLQLGLRYINRPGKERDAAAAVLVRLTIRRDTREILLPWMLDWISSIFNEPVADTPEASEANRPSMTDANVFLINGVLTTLTGILASSEKSALSTADFILVTYRGVVRKIIENEGSPINNNAQIRKLLYRMQRNIATLLLPSTRQEDEDIPETVEEIMDTLLNALGDRDTLVRYAASKALSATCLRLSISEREQILEAIFDMYETNVFYPNRNMPSKADSATRHLKDLSQVSAALWHGLTLTLATFLRSATASLEMLPRVVDCIITALSFEQRKTTFALGSNVRDAACYASWSLARNYPTATLISVPMQAPYDTSKSIPQVIAENLVTTACLDPSGNIRRAASAALQELIGRHPDIVDEGIPLVQAVDYSSVALRSRAVTEVCFNAALLGHRSYWIHLVNGLVDSWRGIAAQDADGRRIAARGLGGLIKEAGVGAAGRQRAWGVLLRVVQRIGPGGGHDVEIRHGGWMALAESLDGIAGIPDDAPDLNSIKTGVSSVPVDLEKNGKIIMENIFQGYRPRNFINSISRPELTCEGACRLIQSLSAQIIYAAEDLNAENATLALRRLYLAILDISLFSPDDIVLSSALQALSTFFPVLGGEQRTYVINVWLRKLNVKTNRKGVVKALGLVLGYLEGREQEAVLAGLLKAAQSTNVNNRVAAIGALCDGALKTGIDTNSILICVSQGLDDYTVDQRGDVGSWMRLEGIRAVSLAYQYGCFKSDATSSDGDDTNAMTPIENKIIRQIVRLSVEKLDKVRQKASEVLYEIYATKSGWAGGVFDGVTSGSEFWTSPDVYYATSLKILNGKEFQLDFLEGYITSAGAGSESTLRTSGRAMIQFLDKLALSHATTTESDATSHVVLTEVIDEMVTLLKKSIGITEDRILVPLLEVLATWFESGILIKLEGIYRFQELFTLVQQAHLKSGNVHKLSAAVKVYAGLTSISSLKTPALKKLVSMLVHPFPKVRSDVADALYLTLTTEGEHEEAELLIMDTDWTVLPKELKEVVTKLKIELAI